ncbi:hypothetical protein GYB22_05210 [bacterium]|nr:hypothetical protein [bacterium]
MKYLYILILALFLSACFGAKTTSNLSQTDVDRMQDKYPGYTLEQLQKGHTLYTEHCGNCHGLKDPKSEPLEEWEEIVPEMAEKIEKKKGYTLSQDQQDLILKYVITMATAEEEQSEE